MKDIENKEIVLTENISPIVYNDITQGSDEWLELRHKCIITASEFHSIITKKTQEPSSDKTIKTFAREKAILHLKTATEMNSINEAERNIPYYSNDMLRGNALETDAVIAYETVYNAKVERVGFITSPCGRFGYSPDGLVGKEGLLEIKSPCFVKHYQYILDGKVPLEYIAQLQGGLMITGREWIDFVSYNQFAPLFCKRIYRDEQYIATLKTALKTLVEYYEFYCTKLQSLKTQSVEII
jgi:hypothetical protein